MFAKECCSWQDGESLYRRLNINDTKVLQYTWYNLMPHHKQLSLRACHSHYGSSGMVNSTKK